MSETTKDKALIKAVAPVVIFFPPIEVNKVSHPDHVRVKIARFINYQPLNTSLLRCPY